MKLPQAFEMTISRADFVRLLPAAVGHQPFEETGSAFSGADAEVGRGRRWKIALTSLPALRIGAICLERHRVQIDYAPLFPEVPPFEQSADAELVKVAERLTGHRAEAVAFGTEAPYLQQLGCETLVLGPGDIDCAHQPGEYLDMSRLQPTVRLLQQLIEHYCLEAKQPVSSGGENA